MPKMLSIIVFILVSSVIAGEYGVTLVDGITDSCRHTEKTNPMPHLLPGEFAEEIKNYFTKDTCAIYGFIACFSNRRIDVCGKPNLDTLQSVFIEIALTPVIKHEEELAGCISILYSLKRIKFKKIKAKLIVIQKENSVSDDIKTRINGILAKID